MLHQAHNLGPLNQVLIIRQAMFGLVSARSAPAGRQERASCGVHLPLNDHWEREGKRRALARLRLDPNPSAVHFDDPLRYCESQAGAALLAGDGIVGLLKT